MADRVMLTTIDNPWNPFTHFPEWYEYDEASGYHSTALLSRVALSSDALSDEDQELAYEEAIEEIVRENVSGVHRRIFLDNGD